MWLGCPIFQQEDKELFTAGLSRLAAVQQSRGYFQQENVKWEDKGTGHPRGVGCESISCCLRPYCT